jgi:hypothetical protein
MKMVSVNVVADFFIIIACLFSIIYTFGVVWRVEKKLDVSFKLFLVAIISFTISEIFLLLNLGKEELTQLISLGFKIVFVIFFLLGILEMRKMLREMDGEIK